MQIHFFGRLGDRIARSIELDLPANVTRVAELRGLAAAAYPGRRPRTGRVRPSAPA